MIRWLDEVGVSDVPTKPLRWLAATALLGACSSSSIPGPLAVERACESACSRLTAGSCTAVCMGACPECAVSSTDDDFDAVESIQCFPEPTGAPPIVSFSSPSWGTACKVQDPILFACDEACTRLTQGPFDDEETPCSSRCGEACTTCGSKAGTIDLFSAATSITCSSSGVTFAGTGWLLKC